MLSLIPHDHAPAHMHDKGPLGAFHEGDEFCRLRRDESCRIKGLDGLFLAIACEIQDFVGIL